MTAARWQAWTPPLDPAALATVLQKMREWEAFDGAALLDDVAAALDAVAPPDEQTRELGERLQGHLVRLVQIALATNADQSSEQTAQLIARAHALRVQEVPRAPRGTVIHLRRMGWVVDGLHEQLVGQRCLREAA
ncbi:DUF6415 family natural product biosynthesis protein [Streptomyces sp. NPDC006975]|uniref:DUF6415 family natural product biosynthesis protein n=1 Tax=Streptomyces sp. NPDC006975 TaxID=3154310 RepID=UPI0034553AAF